MRRLFLLLFAWLAFAFMPPEEGMFPLSELGKLDLQKAGLKIDPKEVYNPDGVSLIDAIVRVGGCTGSFISDQGLMVTNHHCAFSAVAAISTVKDNYLENGFVAKTREQEYKTTLTCRITASYKDVSKEVLEGASGNSDYSNIVKQNIQKIIKEEQQKNASMEYEVSEMFVGRTFVLFRYKTIKDVRLVYVPPRNIGEFGGESDNWVWPRHNADFAMLRAYVAPDGSAAEYNENNVPYKPIKYLKVNAKGIKENDFVFILGYPGRTFRHMPARYLENQYKYQLPFIAALNEWQIAKMEELGANDEGLALRFANPIKRLANTSKNFRGKIQGFKRTNVIQQKKEDEAVMAGIIESTPSLKHQATLFKEIGQLYDEIDNEAPRNMWLQQIYSVNKTLDAASTIDDYGRYYFNLNAEDKLKFKTEKWPKIKQNVQSSMAQVDKLIEIPTLGHMIDLAKNLPGNLRIKAIDTRFANVNEQKIEQTIQQYYQKSIFGNSSKLNQILDQGPDKFFKLKDPLILFASDINKSYNEFELLAQARQNRMIDLIKRYNEIEMLYKISTYVPDANSTLRLTYGYIKGYSPQDAVYHKPFTSLKGVLEKETTTGDYAMPKKLKELYNAKDFGIWMDADLQDIPVGFIYNLDTTGGNSGSPVLNDKGEFIGINFDRAFTATINDYAWNENYSRSIGCDVRYMCFIMEKFSGAKFLLQEMKVL